MIAEGLNPHLETLFLLMVCPWEESSKDETIKELTDVGIDGQEFYDRYYRPVEQYYTTFTKYSKVSPGTALLNDLDESLLSTYAVIFTDHPDWFSSFDSVPDSEVSEAIYAILTDDLPAGSDEDFITYIEKLGLSEKTMWHLLVLQQKPKPRLGLIIDAVSENISAFERARAKVATELDKLLDQFAVEINKSHKVGPKAIPEQIDPDINIIPSLALAVAIIGLEHTCIYGLLVHKTLGNDSDLSKEELRYCAKNLSEASKFEILLLLKDQSRYNLEIAELVNLTPATVSHHMTALLTSGLVDLEKRDGKVYYRLSKDGVKRYLAGCSKFLLM